MKRKIIAVVIGVISYWICGGFQQIIIDESVIGGNEVISYSVGMSTTSWLALLALVLGGGLSGYIGKNQGFLLGACVGFFGYGVSLFTVLFYDGFGSISWDWLSPFLDQYLQIILQTGIFGFAGEYLYIRKNNKELRS